MVNISVIKIVFLFRIIFIGYNLGSEITGSVMHNFNKIHLILIKTIFEKRVFLDLVRDE